MSILNILSAVALILSILGNIMVNLKRKIGFIIWSTSNIFWIIVNLVSVQINWFQIIMFIIYIGLNIHGFLYWTNNIKK